MPSLYSPTYKLIAVYRRRSWALQNLSCSKRPLCTVPFAKVWCPARGSRPQHLADVLVALRPVKVAPKRQSAGWSPSRSRPWCDQRASLDRAPRGGEAATAASAAIILRRAGSFRRAESSKPGRTAAASSVFTFTLLDASARPPTAARPLRPSPPARSRNTGAWRPWRVQVFIHAGPRGKRAHEAGFAHPRGVECRPRRAHCRWVSMGRRVGGGGGGVQAVARRARECRAEPFRRPPRRSCGPRRSRRLRRRPRAWPRRTRRHQAHRVEALGAALRRHAPRRPARLRRRLVGRQRGAAGSLAGSSAAPGRRERRIAGCRPARPRPRCCCSCRGGRDWWRSAECCGAEGGGGGVSVGEPGGGRGRVAEGGIALAEARCAPEGARARRGARTCARSSVSWASAWVESPSSCSITSIRKSLVVEWHAARRSCSWSTRLRERGDERARGRGRGGRGGRGGRVCGRRGARRRRARAGRRAA